MNAFVIMPFDPEFDDIFKIGIKETAKTLEIRAYRLDDEIFEEGMLEKIYSEIQNADLIIADLSDKNPNVFYELGYAHANEKLCILITKSAENIPFDLKHKRHIIYGNKLSILQNQLTENLKWAKEVLEKRKNTPFKIELKTSGHLETNSSFAKAHINFTFDIENKSSRGSLEVQAIYVHSTTKWEIIQKGNKIVSKKSEIKGYSHKYQLIPDISKIPKDGWTQLEFRSSRFIGHELNGVEIKDEYTISGKIYLDIATDKGNFKEEFPVSVFIETLPF